MPILQKLFQKREDKGILLKVVYDTSITPTPNPDNTV